MKKIVVFLLILVITVSMAFIGIGCSSEFGTATTTASETTSAATETTATAETETTAAKESVTISFWALWTEGEANQIVFQEIADKYMSENPNVTVNIKWIGRDVLTKVSSALMAGVDKPDIVNQGFQRLYNSLVKEDLALDWTEYMEENAYGEDVPFKDVFLPGIFDAWKKISGDKVYFIPHYVYTNVIWYNENELNKYGITDTPKTWDELMNACESIKEQGGSPFILDMFPEYISFYMYWLTNRLLGPGYLLMASLDPKGTSFDDPGFLESAKKLQELVDKGYFIKGYEGYKYPAGQIDWTQGKAVFILNGSWILAEVKDNLPEDFVTRAFAFPTVNGKGELSDVEYYPSGFAVLKDTKYPEECVDFIKYYITEESQTKIAEAGAAAPVRKGVPTFKDIEELFNSATTSHHPMDNLQGMNPEWYLKVFNPLNEKLITGSLTAEKYIEEIKQQTIDFWANK